MSVPLDPSNITLLADSLQRLHVAQQELLLPKPDATEASDHPTQQTDTISVPRTPISRDGYGFRRSGISTPQIGHDGQRESQISQDLLVPDPNGLGWPGMLCPCLPLRAFVYEVSQSSEKDLPSLNSKIHGVSLERNPRREGSPRRQDGGCGANHSRMHR